MSAAGRAESGVPSLTTSEQGARGRATVLEDRRELVLDAPSRWVLVRRLASGGLSTGSPAPGLWPKSPIALSSDMETPAFVISERCLVDTMRAVDEVQARTGCRVLYALKPLGLASVLRAMSEHVSGFAASSLFEAKLARDVLGSAGSVHVTTPGFRPDEMERIAEVCDFVVLNSLPQLERYGKLLSEQTSTGLRINPQLSFVKDKRYDPCRNRSKLGVPLDQLVAQLETDPLLLDDIDGIHFHSNCDSASFKPLDKTVRRIMKHLDGPLQRLAWVNLGGGYLFGAGARQDYLYEAIGRLRDRYEVEVFIEPGATLVREVGSLVASVIDLVDIGGETLAYLDTTVNHMPEVYEYQYRPDVCGDNPKGRYRYQLTGSTCLAGDVFGRYAFDTPLEIGSRVVFPDMGAYTLVKAHMFNGINLPSIYTLTTSGEFLLQKRFTYEDFIQRFGEDKSDVCR
jgi:carboxynorspermidine decarboxylase